jgi:hypothetical protein
MRFLFIFCAILWFSTAVGGVFYLMRYESTPGEGDVSYPSVFPAESNIERDGERPTLIFFAHPKCPCTRASLRELSRLMTDTDDKLKVYVVFIKPKDESEQWTQTDSRSSAEAIPNIHVLIDEDQRETRIFNAQTSGLVLLYDRQGNLRFDGGITASRGVEGDSAGSRAIFEIVTQEVDKTAKSSVFGCPLHNKDCPGESMPYAQQ